MNIPIIKIIAYVLWWIEIASLFILYTFFILGKYYSVSIFRGLQMLLMLVGAICILIFPYFDFPENILFFSLFLLALPFGLNSVDKAEEEAKEKRIKEDKEETERIIEYIKKEGDDAGLYMRLGYLYKDLGDYENALKNFKKSCELIKNVALPVTTREIKALEYEINKKKSEKTNICRHCGTQNYPARLFCEKCKKLLDSSIINYFKRLLKITANTGPIVVSLIIVFIISAVLFGFCLDRFANLVFYVLILSNALMFEMSFLEEKKADS